jgi:hypothetical protein
VLGSDLLFLVRFWENIAKPPKYTIQVAAGEVEKSVGRPLAVTAKLLRENVKLLQKDVEGSNRIIHTLYAERKGKLLV